MLKITDEWYYVCYMKIMYNAFIRTYLSGDSERVLELI